MFFFFLARVVIFTAKIHMSDVYGLVVRHAIRKQTRDVESFLDNDFEFAKVY